MNDIKEYLDHLLLTSTPEKPAWNKEAVRENKKAAWNYIDGCMIKAVLEMYSITDDKKYLKFADDFIDYYIDESGNILGYDIEDYNCDNVNEGKVLFPLFEITGKEKYRKAAKNLYQQILTHPKTKEGSFWHKKIYPNQVWLDGLYMVAPFYMEYENKYNKNRNYKDVIHQFENVNRLMKDTSSNLFYHGYDESRESFWSDDETGRSKNFWTRSIGWYTMALVDTIEAMDEQLFYEYDLLQRYLRELLYALRRVQDEETKMYYQVTDQGKREGNYLETSGTCAIAYSFMKGARLSFVPEYYYDYGKEIFDCVLKQKLVKEDDSFVLKDICLVAGLGGMPGKGDYELRDGTYEYYISEPVVNDDAKGVAPFLLAFTEIYRQEHKK